MTDDEKSQKIRSALSDAERAMTDNEEKFKKISSALSDAERAGLSREVLLLENAILTAALEVLLYEEPPNEKGSFMIFPHKGKVLIKYNRPTTCVPMTPDSAKKMIASLKWAAELAKLTRGDNNQTNDYDN